MLYHMDSFYEIVDNIQPNIIITTSTINDNITNLLLKYQIDSVINLINIIHKYHVALDMSDTGTGKTYVAAAICKALNLKPIIICPKTLIYNWISILNIFDVQYYEIVNYETIKNLKSYNDSTFSSRKQSNILYQSSTQPFEYIWNVPSDSIIIFDEVHRCKDIHTDNSKLLLSCKKLLNEKIPLLLLSATICEKWKDMQILFYLFGIINDPSKYHNYLKNKCKNKKISKEKIIAYIIHSEIKKYSTRIKISDLGNQFPKKQICTQQFFIKNPENINKLINQLHKNSQKNHLTKIQKIKQEIEFKKIPVFIEQTQLYLDKGKSVIIFVNYLKTFHYLCNKLNIISKIYGDQSINERHHSIQLFQSNQEKIIISQIKAGSVGINLNDLHGTNPRVSLISCPDSASDLLQALGRAYRTGTKTPVLQRIIFAANIEYENFIMTNINKKLNNISVINDGDLTYFY